MASSTKNTRPFFDQVKFEVTGRQKRSNLLPIDGTSFVQAMIGTVQPVLKQLFWGIN